MPIINDRYYANPQYGRALEQARAADEEFTRLHGKPQPSWLDHFLGFAEESSVERRGGKSGTQHDSNGDRLAPRSNPEDRSDRAAMSYSEKTNGTVAEHEAIQSTVMNRVAGGEKQYVGKGQTVNEYNVIHAPNQYQGVPPVGADLKDRRGPFEAYKSGKANDTGANNAAQADENLMRTGKPANDATFFIANPGGKAPTARQVHNLGNVEPAGRVGGVYLYKPRPRAAKH